VLAPFFGERAKPLFADTVPAIAANELDPHVGERLQRNAETAGVKLRYSQGDFRSLDPQTLGSWAKEAGKARLVIVCNPPYGVRSLEQGGELSRLYRDFGEWCRRFSGARLGVVVANPTFETAFGGRPRLKKPLSMGPLRGYFYLYDL